MTKCMLLDIEGTTTPIDFVHKTLFPFAKERIDDFVHTNETKLGIEISELKAEASLDTEFKESVETSSDVVSYLKFLIEVDRKSTPLKSIQGKIWRRGYESGELLSEVYEDVVVALSRWKSAGKSVAIYSSGSIEAQKLLFRYSNQGDLTVHIDEYFDTTSGNKKETESYSSIVRELGVSADEVTFVSDVPDELEAARDGGLQTVLSVRPGNAEVGDEHGFKTIYSFDELE